MKSQILEWQGLHSLKIGKIQKEIVWGERHVAGGMQFFRRKCFEDIEGTCQTRKEELIGLQ